MEDQWSKYLGQMTWRQAMAKAASLGMRLPTRAELRKAFANTDTEFWRADWEESARAYYWTSEESSEDCAYLFFVDNGYVTDGLKDYGYLHVRCIR